MFYVGVRMRNEEESFNINDTMHMLYHQVEPIATKRSIELIYNMGSTLPKEFRGNNKLLIDFLTKIVSLVLKNSDNPVLIISLSTVKDFVYEENVTFCLKNSCNIFEIMSLPLEQHFSNEIKELGVVFKECINGNICFDIPLKINELGLRRHYRLNSDDLLNKKVLIVCENEHIGYSIKKFFIYFNYKVDIGYEGTHKDLTQYDILVIEKSCLTDFFKENIIHAHNDHDLKCAWIDPPYKTVDIDDIVDIHIKKPITQESIFLLIEKLFNQEVSPSTTKSKKNRIYSFPKKDALIAELEEKKAETVSILNVENGYKNSDEYTLLLKEFLDHTKSSDIYFRQIVNQKDVIKLREFCDLIEKEGHLIGAEVIVS